MTDVNVKDRIERIFQKFDVRKTCDPVPKCERLFEWHYMQDEFKSYLSHIDYHDMSRIQRNTKRPEFYRLLQEKEELTSILPAPLKCKSKLLDQWDKKVWMINDYYPFGDNDFEYNEDVLKKKLKKLKKHVLNSEKELTGEKFQEMKKIFSIEKSIEEGNRCVKENSHATNPDACKRYIQEANIPPRGYRMKMMMGGRGYNTRIPHPEWDSCINKYCGTEREMCNSALKKACDEMCNYPGVKPDDKQSCVQSCHKIDKRYLQKLHPDVNYPRQSKIFSDLNKSTPENLIKQCIDNNNKVAYENAKNGKEADFLCKVPDCDSIYDNRMKSRLEAKYNTRLGTGTTSTLCFGHQTGVLKYKGGTETSVILIKMNTTRKTVQICRSTTVLEHALKTKKKIGARRAILCYSTIKFVRTGTGTLNVLWLTMNTTRKNVNIIKFIKIVSLVHL